MKKYEDHEIAACWRLMSEDETGRLRGQQVLAWFNPELPELLAVTDMNRENCFTVERAEDVPAMDAAPEVLSREMARVNAHNGYARQRYRMVAPLANLNARPTIIDAATARLGQDIETQSQTVKAERTKRQKLESTGRSVFAEAGITPRFAENVRPEQIDAAKRFQAARKKFKEEPAHE
jgi:hypothetical protein